MASLTELEYLEQLRLTSKRLAAGEINSYQFDEECIAACVRYRGPPPEGREYIVGIVGGRIIVGHIETVSVPLGDLRPWRGSQS